MGIVIVVSLMFLLIIHVNVFHFIDFYQMKSFKSADTFNTHWNSFSRNVGDVHYIFIIIITFISLLKFHTAANKYLSSKLT